MGAVCDSLILNQGVRSRSGYTNLGGSPVLPHRGTEGDAFLPNGDGEATKVV